MAMVELCLSVDGWEERRVTLKRIFLIVIAISLAACTDPKQAEKVLKQQGYTSINAGGYSWLGCSQDDTYATEFTAISPNGSPVKGAVCAGAFGKGSTIRFFD